MQFGFALITVGFMETNNDEWAADKLAALVAKLTRLIALRVLL